MGLKKEARKANRQRLERAAIVRSARLTISIDLRNQAKEFARLIADGETEQAHAILNSIALSVSTLQEVYASHGD